MTVRRIVIGDVHGCREELEELVSASLSQRGPAYDLLHLVQTGVIIGFSSVEVVEEARAVIQRLGDPTSRSVGHSGPASGPKSGMTSRFANGCSSPTRTCNR
jgi:hypothetical protein